MERPEYFVVRVYRRDCSDPTQIEGTVEEVFPNTTCRVVLANGHRVLGHLSGKLRLSFCRVGVGDKVKLEMSPYDLSKGCIIEN